LKFKSFSQAAAWSSRLLASALQSGVVEKSFAFKFYAHTKEFNPELHTTLTNNVLTNLPYFKDDVKRADELFQMEVKLTSFLPRF